MLSYARNDPRWKRARERFVTESKALPRFVETYYDGRNPSILYAVWHVESSSDAGHLYTVRVRSWGETLGVECDCPAGSFGNPCWHAVACVDASYFRTLVDMKGATSVLR